MTTRSVLQNCGCPVRSSVDVCLAMRKQEVDKSRRAVDLVAYGQLPSLMAGSFLPGCQASLQSAVADNAIRACTARQ